jgi:eukaryotic-like serine/threonine-protein kinase
MTNPDSSDRSVGCTPDKWLEALHDAVVSGRDREVPLSTEGRPADQAAAVRACLQMIERVRQARLAGEPTPLPPADDTLSESPATAGPRRIGRFEILRDLGRGGHGIVFLALDPALGRQVALKVPRPEMLLSPNTRQRFLREAHAAARLSHPHIVAVYEVGDGLPVCYIAAEYYPGESLHAYLRSQPTAISPRSAAVLCRELAAAVQYAHDHGVLHRDLKPSNVLLAKRHASTTPSRDANFPFEPKLTDFGLARLLEHDADQTRTGALVGTPAYMAPEQAEGRVHDIGPCTDVYGLGAVLYEMLTGRPPFQGMTDVDTLRRVLSGDPVRPRQLRREVPHELEAICLRALEKNPRRRYSSAQALGADLNNFLQGRPVDAKSPTPLDRLAKWSRRNPALATVWVLGALLILVLIWSNLRVRGALEETKLQTAIAQSNERAARRSSYGTDLRQAGEAWENAQPIEARNLLEKYLPRDGQEDLRGPEWRYLWSSLNTSSQVVAEQPSQVWSLAVSRDDACFATGDDKGIVRLWQTEPPALLHELSGHAVGHVDAVVFSYDGQILFSGADDGMIRQWDVSSGKALRAWQAHEGWIGALAVSPRNEHLASGGSDGRVRIWNALDGQLVGECKRHPDAVRWLEFHRNHKWLASAAFDHPVHLENYRSPEKQTVAPDGLLEAKPGNTLRAFVIGRHGASVWGCGNELIQWNIHAESGKGEITNAWPATGGVKSLAVVNNWIIESYDSPPIIRVRDALHDCRESHVLRGHSDSVRVLVPLSAGALLSGSEDGTVRKWRLDGGQQVRQHFRLKSTPYLLAWSPNGRYLVAFLEDGSQWMRNGQSEPVCSEVPATATEVFEACVTNDGRLLTMDNSGAVRWSRLGELLPPAVFQLPPLSCCASLDAANKTLAVADDMQLLVMDAHTGQRQWEFEHPGAIREVAFLPDGRLLTACRDGIVRAFGAASGRLLDRSEPARKDISTWDISPNFEQVLVSSEDQTIRLLDLATLDEQKRFPYANAFMRSFFAGDPQRLIVCDADGFNILDGESGQTLIAVAHKGPSSVPRLSPDGRLLAISGGHSLFLYRCD